MKNLFLFCLSILLLTSCGEDNVIDTDTNGFDQTELLLNLSDNLILPALNDFKANAIDLQNKANAFSQTPTQNTLDALRSSFVDAYKQWQNVNMFEFGPAENIAYRNNINTYPTDVNNIESLIELGNYNLDAISNYDSKGFPALDYLLYGGGENDAAILALFSIDAKKENYQKYLSDVINDIIAKTNTVYNAWINGYDTTFKNNKGSDIGSATSTFINAYIQHYENRFRTLKLGIPAGVFSIEGETFATRVEAFYSGISIDLIEANFIQLEKLYTGGTGEGLDDYLQAVNAINVDTEIKTKLANIETALNNLTPPLSSQVENDKATVVSVYNEIQKLVPTLKADMSSALSIQITFADTDGD